jgi:hypothetical protein
MVAAGAGVAQATVICCERKSAIMCFRLDHLKYFFLVVYRRG